MHRQLPHNFGHRVFSIGKYTKWNGHREKSKLADELHSLRKLATMCATRLLGAINVKNTINDKGRNSSRTKRRREDQPHEANSDDSSIAPSATERLFLNWVDPATYSEKWNEKNLQLARLNLILFTIFTPVASLVLFALMLKGEEIYFRLHPGSTPIQLL